MRLPFVLLECCTIAIDLVENSREGLVFHGVGGIDKGARLTIRNALHGLCYQLVECLGFRGIDEIELHYECVHLLTVQTFG